MADQVLAGLRVAVLAADGFEPSQVMRPTHALEQHGVEVDVVSLRAGSIQGMSQRAPTERLPVDATVRTADVWDYDGLVIPGGFGSPDLLRQSMHALEFVRTFDDQGKPIATICQGAWVLISAGLVKGRRIAAWPGIRDDVRNAGGTWIDARVVHDDNWLTSRGPLDLDAFVRAIVAHLAQSAGRRLPGTLRGVGLGRLIVGTAAAAAAGYAVRRRFGSGRAGMGDAGTGDAGGRGRGAEPPSIAPDRP